MSGYIAKDDLIELLSDMQGRCGTRAELRQNSKIWNQVKDMPTVDAIPIKWLEDRRDEIANKLDEVAGVLDLEELAEAYCCQLNTINWLIDTWLERRFE